MERAEPFPKRLSSVLPKLFTAAVPETKRAQHHSIIRKIKGRGRIKSPALCYFPGFPRICCSHERVWLLDGGSLSIQGKPESTFSVLCHSDRAEGVTIRGARFGLENAVMTNRFPLGISNRIGEERIATISVEKGILFVIYPKEV